MDDSFIARMGYDPVRIFARIHGHRPTGIARLGPPPGPEPATPPPEVKAAEVGDSPPPGEESTAPTAEGGNSPPDPLRAGDEYHPRDGGEARRAGSTPRDPDNLAVPPRPDAQFNQGDDACGVEGHRGPPRPEGEDRKEDEEDDFAPTPANCMQAWLVDNWDAIKALEAAGKLPPIAPPEAAEPERPAPPPRPAPAPPEPVEGPVHVARGDRWNKWKMAEFLRQLAATHSVTAAARAVGMSRKSAYKLRARLKGQPFDIAWEAAFRHGYDDLALAALELALEGEEVPHYHQGELKATHRKRHPQLMVQLLKMRNRAGRPMLGRYGAAAEFWSERWERMVRRVETGSVTWDDEKTALGARELERLELPDEEREADLLIQRNMPDDPRGR